MLATVHVHDLPRRSPESIIFDTETCQVANFFEDMFSLRGMAVDPP